MTPAERETFRRALSAARGQQVYLYGDGWQEHDVLFGEFFVGGTQFNLDDVDSIEFHGSGDIEVILYEHSLRDDPAEWELLSQQYGLTKRRRA